MELRGLKVATTYEPIATTTLSSAAASVTFSSISGSYTDLVLIVNAKNTTGSQSPYLQFNSDTGSNYSETYLRGDGTTASSGRDLSQTKGYVAFLNNEWGNAIINIQNYSNTTTYKTIISRSARSTMTAAVVTLWRSTSAITSVLINADGGDTFVAGSTFTLYGIKAA